MSALEMNPAIRARWVAALRSGKYPQGHEYLRDKTGGLCCLGVLCELAVTDGVIPAPEKVGDEWLYVNEADDDLPDIGTDLPDAVRRWAGLARANPAPPAAPGGLSLAELNDGSDESDDDDSREPWTFAQIAALIEGRAS